MTNVNESKIQFLGKAPKCAHCNKLYSLKKMDETQTTVAHTTGLCPKCQSNDVLVAKFSPAKKQVTTKSTAAIKPGVAVREAFMSLVNNNLVTEEVLADFQDKDFTLKHTGIKYAFIKEVNPNIDIKEQTFVYGKARYSTKPITVNGKQFLVTNDIYAKNVERFVELTKSFAMPVAI